MASIACLALCLFSRLLFTTWAENLEPVLPAIPHCPEEGFAYYNGSQWFCFQFFQDVKNFSNAEDQCRQCGSDGHLASLTSKTETNIIASYVTERNVDKKYRVWIGLRRDPTSDMQSGWYWTDRTPFLYTNWRTGEPNNYRGQEFCGAFTHETGHRQWTDYNCVNKKRYLCKWKA